MKHSVLIYFINIPKELRSQK